MPRQLHCFGLLLMIYGACSARVSTAQPQPITEQQFEQRNKQCLAAKTPTQCREAIPACQRVTAALDQQTASPDHDAAQNKILSHLANCEITLGQFAQAEQHYRRSLKIRQRVYGGEHTEVAFSLNNLAIALAGQAKYGEAETLYRQALAMHQKLLGVEHPHVASSFNNLASVLLAQGKYGETETLYRQALAMRQKLLGAEHPEVARSLANLAVALTNQGKYGEAETLHRQALGMLQKLLGAEHPDVAANLNNLATVLHAEGKYGEAETLHQQVLAMRQKLLGVEHPDVAGSLDNLALALTYQGKYGEAETLFQQALAMRQKLLGAEHPDVAHNLNNLASVLDDQGKQGVAEALFRQALAMQQKLLGLKHPEVAKSLDKLSGLLLTRGQLPQAISLLREAARISEGQLRVTVSETRMHALLSTLRNEEDMIYGLLLSASANAALRQLALTTALLRKGRAAEAGASTNRFLHRHLTDLTLHQRFSQWQAVRQQREALLYRGPGELNLTVYRARLKDLQQESESLEAQLSIALPDLKKLHPPDFDAILSTVASRLPRQAALIEVVWASPWQAQATGTEPRWGSPHYIALLFFPDRRIRSVDLGEATGADSRVRALLEALRNPQTDPTPAAYSLYQQILAPMLPQLSGVSELYLSLDGTLNLVPFDALHDGRDYLLGRYRFHYLTSGRDLLRGGSKQTPGPALLLANPDFGKADSSSPPAVPRTLYQRLAGLSRLPGTEREAEMVASLLGVVPLLNGRAREEAVRVARAPFVLHIATHGLFLNDTDLPPPPEMDRGIGSFSMTREVRTKNVSFPENELLPGEAGAMNRSALALAGVLQGDRAPSPAQDGLLTAEEARSLNLDGTQLVVLSACETGQGAISAGQGVYGLRRAFLVAGAETLVTSLWRVHDEATGELMGMYYRKLMDKKKPGDRLGSMQEAMQELRTRPGRSHPYYWAPFLVIGQAGPLRPPAAKGL